MSTRFNRLLRPQIDGSHLPPAARASAPRISHPAVEALGLEDMGDKWTGPCPACQAEESDSEGRHLVLYPTGAWGCIKNPGDSGADHRAEMLRLAPCLAGDKEYKPNPAAEAARAKRREIAEAAEQAARELLIRIVEANIPLPEGGELPSEGRGEFAVLAEIFEPDDTVWLGKLRDRPAIYKRTARDGTVTLERGEFPGHCHRLNSPEAIEAAYRLVVGGLRELTILSSWKTTEGPTAGRSAENQGPLRGLVVEHDLLNYDQSLALIGWVARDLLPGRLRWVLSTGGRGCHGIFDARGIDAPMLADLTEKLTTLGVDGHALSRGATRIPGVMRQLEGSYDRKRQALVWVAKKGQTK